MTRVVVITTGGTIATSTDADGVLRPTRTGATSPLVYDRQVVDLMAEGQLAADARRLGPDQPPRSRRRGARRG